MNKGHLRLSGRLKHVIHPFSTLKQSEGLTRMTAPYGACSTDASVEKELNF